MGVKVGLTTHYSNVCIRRNMQQSRIDMMDHPDVGPAVVSNYMYQSKIRHYYKLITKCIKYLLPISISDSVLYAEA